MWRRQATTSAAATACRSAALRRSGWSDALFPSNSAASNAVPDLPSGQRRNFAGRGGPNFQGFPGGFGGFPGGPGGPVNNDKLYKLLEIDQGASEADIKAAYKKQALKHHPDRGGDANTFKDVSRAYEVLSDPQKKQIYDQFGEEGLDGAPQGPAGAGADPYDIFSQIFGFNMGQRNPRGRPVTQDSVYELQLSLEEFYAGTTRSIKFSRNCLCKTCSGQGGKDKKNCQRCGGTGVNVTVQQNGLFSQSFHSACGSCGGKGYSVKTECGDCKGKGTVQEQKTFSVDIEPGASDGQQFQFRGQADEAPGHDTGDVIIIAKEKSHKTFKRMNDALLMTKKISLADALCGYEFSTVFLDGKELVIRSQPGKVVKPNQLMRVSGKGMPRRQGQKPGDLFVQIEVDFPANVDAEKREQLAALLGGKAIPQDKSAGVMVADSLSSTQAEELRLRWAQTSQQRRGQEVGCHQQ